MKLSTQLRCVLLGATAVAMVQHAALVWAQDNGDVVPIVGSRPSMGSLLPPPAGAMAPVEPTSSTASLPGPDVQARASSTQGDVATLMQLIRDAQLVELRTTYNGSYGASLFFYPPDMTWYVALFQDKRFWRVIRSQDETRAEAIYADFARQTEQLSEVEIRRTQLEAQKAFLERVIALSEDRARRLQADLDVARTQQANVNARQSQMQADAAALRAEKVRAQAQLEQLQRAVRALERANEAGLPGASRR